MSSAPKALRYWGGKSSYSPNQVCQWVTEKLPWQRKSTYVEPFAGMLGVLLNRRPVSVEVVSDADGAIINWWRQIRDNTEEFATKLEWTAQRSRQEYDLACDRVNIPGVEGAIALTLVLNNQVVPTSTAKTYNFVYDRNSNTPVGQILLPDQVWDIHNRIKNVVFETRDFAYLLERFAENENAVIYCDPPYYSSEGKRGYAPDFDYELCGELLAIQKGKVAISGYGTEWDSLGWDRHSRQAWAAKIPQFTEPKDATEVLWTNYDVPDTRLF